MIEHEPWVPSAYQNRLANDRIAICGFSHYSDELDYAELTQDVLSRVTKGEVRYRFFSSIAIAFKESVCELFGRSIFFNFLPSSVGSSSASFSPGTKQQIELGRNRVLRILSEHKPNKIFVFSTKAWHAFPSVGWRHRGLISPGGLSWGTYDVADFRTIAIGCRHPQGAAADHLANVVEAGLALPQVE